MSIRDIVLYPHEVLTKKARPVADIDDEVRQLVDDMVATMYDAPGIGLAAPQVGVLQRLTVIDVSSREEEPPDLKVLINPEIVHREGKIVWEEGCLSIPGIYEKVERAEKVVVQALDRDGEEYELEADGLLSVCIQHEIDHLDGVLFLQHLSGLKRRLAIKKYRKVLDRMEKEAAEGKDDEEGDA